MSSDMSSDTGRAQEWRLVRRPKGLPVPGDVELVELDVPTPSDGQVLVRNLYLSVDPYMRGRMNDAASYAAPYGLGKAMYGGAVGQVVSTRDPDLAEGTFVRTGKAWRTHAVCRRAELEVVDAQAASLPAYLGVLGMPGLTAWVGTFDIGQARPGETVWVSAASGAVGSLAGQLAKLAGCRVIGTAGGAEKARLLVDELGFDAGIDYRDGDLEGQVRQAAPDGVDVYFENVGGDHLRAALAVLNPFGRIAACGMISSYNNDSGSTTPGPDNMFLVVGKKITMRGFIVGDHAARTPVFTRHVAGLLREGRITYRETVVEGIEATFDAFLGMLSGGSHVGKLVVHVGDPA